MRFEALSSLGLGVLTITALSCGDSVVVIDPSPSAEGELSVAISAPGSLYDVSAVRIDIVASGEDCGGTVLASETVAVEGEVTSVEAFFVLSAGDKRVCATPLAETGPSLNCATAEALVTVVAGQTSSVTLTSQCSDGDNAGLHSVVSFNDAPSISALTIAPGAQISVCEAAQLAVVGTDSDGDALSFEWTLADPLQGSLRSVGSSATFSALVPGAYVVNVTAQDGHGGSAALSVPIHVSDAVCGVAPEVQGIFLASCGPCHTTGASGGLKLDTAESAYANLVRQPVRGAACTSSTRVVPGDASASYLIAKLRGSPGICGVQMPRGLPPLPEEQIQIIEGWINSLPD